MKRTCLLLIFICLVSAPSFARKKPVQPSERAVFHNNQGVTYLNQGQFERAEFEFKTAAELSPDYAKVDDAIKMIKKAIKKDPVFSDAYYNLGLRYLEKTKQNPAKSYIKFAEAEFKKATELNPTLKLVHTELAKMYRELGDFEHAVIRYRLALEDYPNDVDAWLKLGNLYLEMKEPFKAQNTFLKAVEINPDSAEAHQQLGMFYYNEGRFEEALTELEEVARLQPISELAYYRVGTVKLNIGDAKKQTGDAASADVYYDAAKAAFQHSLEINPNFADASFNLGLVYLKQGNNEEARRQWEHTLILDPKHGRTLYNIGTLYNYIGNKKASLEKLCLFLRLGIKDYATEAETARKITESHGGCP
ncbi:MAG: tetratricopeptide repeat protein [Deltaproteobacteria bacterium]|nr:tetratricopeptide repeat protein [Deltaproteobacteria bacterium]